MVQYMILYFNNFNSYFCLLPRRDLIKSLILFLIIYFLEVLALNIKQSCVNLLQHVF